MNRPFSFQAKYEVLQEAVKHHENGGNVVALILYDTNCKHT